MFQSLFEQTGYRLALRQVEKRRRAPLREDLPNRRLLAILPQAEGLIQPAMSLIQQIDLAPDRITLIWTADAAPEVPGGYQEAVYPIGADDINLFNLPRGKVCEPLMEPYPDVAIDLMPEFALPFAYLVGRSPAAFRIGLYHERAEPFRDILLRYEGDQNHVYGALRRTLYEMKPTIVPMQPLSTRVFL